MAGKDFVQVRLTPAGEKLADGHPLTVNNGRRPITFKPGEETRVDRSYEWAAYLAPFHTNDGSVLFELVPGAPIIVTEPKQQREEDPA